MDELLRNYKKASGVETVSIKAKRFAELVQQSAIYEMFEIAAETSENPTENFKPIAEMFPSVCVDGCMVGAEGMVTIPEDVYCRLVCSEQNLYELFLLLEKENFYIVVGELIKFLNTKRMAQGLAELVPVVERNDVGVVVGRTRTEEGALDA